MKHLFCHVTLPTGVHRVPRAVAERAGWPIVGDLPNGHERPDHKPRVDIDDAVTPQPHAVAPVTADSEERA